MAPKYLIASFLLLYVFCWVINTPPTEWATWKIPGQLAARGNIRKALKESMHQRQVSTLLILTVLLSNDIQTNPGPRARNIYPCGLCDSRVETSAVACDNCSVWYHRECLELCSADLQPLGRSNVSWICYKCDSMNCNSFTFRSYILDNSHTSNYYFPLMDLDSTSSIDSFHSGQNFSPTFKSSPRDKSRQSSRLSEDSNTHRTPPRSNVSNQGRRRTPPRTNSSSSNVYNLPRKQNFRLLNINCQCMVRKRAEFAALLDYVKPDVICGTEGYKLVIYPARFFPIPTMYTEKTADL